MVTVAVNGFMYRKMSNIPVCSIAPEHIVRLAGASEDLVQATPLPEPTPNTSLQGFYCPPLVRVDT